MNAKVLTRLLGIWRRIYARESRNGLPVAETVARVPEDYGLWNRKFGGAKNAEIKADNKNRDIYIRNAWDAQIAGGKAEALEKWELVLQRWPKDSAGYCGVAAMARETGRLDYAARVIDEALQYFPQEHAVISSAAHIASYRGDWTASVALWERIIDKNSKQIDWHVSYVMGLLTLGEFEKVKSWLTHLRKVRPNHRSVIQLEAMLESSLQNYDAALALWRKYRKLFPDDPVGWEHYGRVHQARELARIDKMGSGDATGPSRFTLNAPVDIAVVDEPETRTLLMNFESIGFNCEFGLVQRRFGAEPISLLRFNSVGFGGLLAAIAHRFEGMGKPENTKLFCAGNGEYYLEDKRWGLGMHTFVFKGQQHPDLLFKKMCKRAEYLRDKFLSDLEEERKIFVFMSPDLTREDVLFLHNAFYSIAPIKLLHVRPVTADPLGFELGPPGGAREIAPNLFLGYLGRPGVAPNGTWDIAFDDWVAICQNVRSIVTANQASVVERTLA